MARVEFHFNAPALVPYACRLLRKAYGRGLRTQVVGNESTLGLLDQALWTFSTLDFVPHCRENAPATWLSASSVLLGSAVQTDWKAQILVNLGDGVPENLDAFDRIIDIVTVDDLHRAQGRERWRHYARSGHELIRHDLSQATAA